MLPLGTQLIRIPDTYNRGWANWCESQGKPLDYVITLDRYSHDKSKLRLAANYRPRLSQFTIINAGMPDEVSPSNPPDMVDQPKHYQFWPGIEAKDIMKAVSDSGLLNDMSPVEGHYFLNKLKYHLRAGSKGDALEDLAKGKKYTEMGIKVRNK